MASDRLAPRQHEGHSGHSGAGSTSPESAYLATMYWALIGAAIAFATVVNLLFILQAKQRLSAARKKQPTPAKPKSGFWLPIATVTAIVREGSSSALPAIVWKRWTLRSPTVGQTSIVLANMIVLVVLCFYKLDPSDRWSYSDIGYRTGWITLCQIPLVFLFVGKNNLVGWLSGVSYEKLNWLHRWTARTLLLTATIHMGYWFSDWAPYNYIGTKISTEPITRRGMIAWALLVWIVFSSATPIRGWNYEFFVLQHLVSFAAFIGMVYVHIPAGGQIWIWIPVGLFFFDRLLRTLRLVYTNLSIFHPKQRREGKTSGLWACRASFEPISRSHTRITIHDPPISWTPGQHVFLSCHSVLPLQSHPFTIASIPSDGKMQFLVKAEKGGTRRLLMHAEKHQALPSSNLDLAISHKRAVAIEGPYGCMRSLQQFDSALLFAGSTGATFIVPLLRDIVHSWSTGRPAATRYVRLVWVVKSKDQFDWFSDQLRTATEEVQDLRESGLDVRLEISTYITCDPTFTTENKTMPSSCPAPATTDPHGNVQAHDESGSFPKHSDIDDEKTVLPKTYAQQIIRELDSSSVSSGGGVPKPSACGPDGTCCCTETIEDDDGERAQAVCTCDCSAGPSNLDQRSPSELQTCSSSFTGEKPKPLQIQQRTISCFAGRPQPMSLIRKMLEQALGESAVVVCGPSSLVADVRASVVALSDERGVHKGTGAQGIYLHCEGFGL